MQRMQYRWDGATSGFPDTGAYYIWNTPNAVVSAPVGVLTKFWYQYTVPMSSAPFGVTLYFILDNYGYTYLNDNFLGYVTAGWTCAGCYTTLKGTFNPGQNFIEVACTNVGGPAGKMTL
jgi:hypothetical protein